MRDVEFKAELRDPGLARATCRALGAAFILEFGQADTYYRVPTGKLKRRESEGEPTEWIFYERPLQSGPKISEFEIFTEEQAAERFGTAPLPEWVTVRKRRELWMIGNVRIHLDEVEGLGAFLEFEALVSRDHGVDACRARVAELREEFRPILGEAIDCGYADMLGRDQDNP